MAEAVELAKTVGKPASRVSETPGRNGAFG